MAQTPVVTAIRSVPWKVGNALAVFLVPWVFLPIIAVIGAAALAPHLGIAHTFNQGIKDDSPGTAFALELVDGVGSFLIIGYYLRKYGANISTLGWRRFSILKVLGYIALVFLAFVALVTVADILIKVLYPAYNVDQPQTNEFTKHTSSLSLWALVILPPIVEETVYRGFIFPAFAKRYGVWIGAIIASVLFGFAHLQLNVSIYTFVLGLLLCLLYSRVGSIIPGIGIHMLNNYIAYMATQHK